MQAAEIGNDNTAYGAISCTLAAIRAFFIVNFSQIVRDGYSAGRTILLTLFTADTAV